MTLTDNAKLQLHGGPRSRLSRGGGGGSRDITDLTQGEAAQQQLQCLSAVLLLQCLHTRTHSARQAGFYCACWRGCDVSAAATESFAAPSASRPPARSHSIENL